MSSDPLTKLRSVTARAKRALSDAELGRKYCSCVLQVSRKGGRGNPHAICTKSVGRPSGRRVHCTAHSSFVSALSPEELIRATKGKHIPRRGAGAPQDEGGLRRALISGSRALAKREHALRKQHRKSGISRGTLVRRIRVQTMDGKVARPGKMPLESKIDLSVGTQTLLSPPPFPESKRWQRHPAQRGHHPDGPTRRPDGVLVYVPDRIHAVPNALSAKACAGIIAGCEDRGYKPSPLSGGGPVCRPTSSLSSLYPPWERCLRMTDAARTGPRLASRHTCGPTSTTGASNSAS